MRNISIISALILPLAVACGDPCVDGILRDDIIAEQCMLPDATGDASSTGAADSSSGSGGECVPPAENLCDVAPLPGMPWGPCINGNTCAAGECVIAAMGTMCVLPCDDCGCPAMGDGCSGGTCSAANLCVPQCLVVGDPCPFEGMQCDFLAGQCIWLNG